MFASETEVLVHNPFYFQNPWNWTFKRFKKNLECVPSIMSVTSSGLGVIVCDQPHEDSAEKCVNIPTKVET